MFNFAPLPKVLAKELKDIIVKKHLVIIETDYDIQCYDTRLMYDLCFEFIGCISYIDLRTGNFCCFATNENFKGEGDLNKIFNALVEAMSNITTPITIINKKDIEEENSDE